MNLILFITIIIIWISSIIDRIYVEPLVDGLSNTSLWISKTISQLNKTKEEAHENKEEQLNAEMHLTIGNSILMKGWPDFLVILSLIIKITPFLFIFIIGFRTTGESFLIYLGSIGLLFIFLSKV